MTLQERIEASWAGEHLDQEAVEEGDEVGILDLEIGGLQLP